MSDGPPSKYRRVNDGELRVIRGAKLEATLQVATAPFFVRTSPDRERLFAVGERAVTAIDLLALRVITHIALDEAGQGAADLALTADGTRGFVLYAESSRLEVLDLEAGKALASLTTGRGSKKFFKVLGTVASMVSVVAPQSTTLARSGGFSVSIRTTDSVYYAAPASTTIALRPDDKFAYVLNSQTNDVTIVDIDRSEVLEKKIGGGGHELRLLTGGDVLAVVDDSKIHLLDTQTNSKRAELKLKKLRGLFLSPDGKHAVALAEKQVVCLDGATGKVTARLAGFVTPTQVLFDDATAGIGATHPSEESGR